MKLLVCYDVANDERRERLARILLDYGERVQESVFWLESDDELIGRMRQRVAAAIDGAADNVWLVPVCEACVRRLESIGVQPVPAIPEYYVV